MATRQPSRSRWTGFSRTFPTSLKKPAAVNGGPSGSLAGPSGPLPPFHRQRGYAGSAPSTRDEYSDFELFEYGIYKYHYGERRVEVHMEGAALVPIPRGILLVGSFSPDGSS